MDMRSVGSGTRRGCVGPSLGAARRPYAARPIVGYNIQAKRSVSGIARELWVLASERIQRSRAGIAPARVAIALRGPRGVCGGVN
eukprot:2887460-Prymnesium_polylepis.1